MNVSSAIGRRRLGGRAHPRAVAFFNCLEHVAPCCGFAVDAKMLEAAFDMVPISDEGVANTIV